MERLIPAVERQAWREALAPLGELDATFLPEYHLAYALRIPGSAPVLWHFQQDGQHLVYPFLLTPVSLEGRATPYFDITGIYGYTGPMATTTDPGFLRAAWAAFDGYTAGQKVVAEFVRFSPFNRNEGLAHPQTQVIANRTLAASQLGGGHQALLQSLGSKTRNMLRKAEREGLAAREVPLPQYLPEFQDLYGQTMARNGAPTFFHYDDAYWDRLLELGPQGLRLFGTFAGSRMVAASMAVAHGRSGLYHLGASLTEYARLGAGNLSLFAMSCGLMDAGVAFLNMTGGRTAAPDDPLLLFKRSNSNGTATFHIGKRVVDPLAYNALATQWRELRGSPPDAEKVVFWRP